MPQDGYAVVSLYFPRYQSPAAMVRPFAVFSPVLSVTVTMVVLVYAVIFPQAHCPAVADGDHITVEMPLMTGGAVPGIWFVLVPE